MLCMPSRVVKIKTIIGFEIHEQINTKTKLYCYSPTNYRDVPPNTNICEVCTGMPGAKPQPINQDAIDAAVEIALMLNCEIVDKPIYIQRKHYDYPDLPSGYQRTSLPIGKNGNLNGVGIWEVHIEEDPGKYDPISGTVDYNRSGVPLVEIVTAPDIHSPEEGRNFLRELTKVLEYTGKVRPEGGTMRMDTNISLEGGAKVEIKNINSVRGAYRALKFEIARQKNLQKRGVKIKQETRAFLEAQMITKAMRTKETAEDYRYIPDPDIPPLVISKKKVSEIKKKMPEAPHMKLQRFMRQYGINRDDAWAITSEIEYADAFEKVCAAISPSVAASYFRNNIKKVLTYRDIAFRESGITAEHIIELLEMIKNREITVSTGDAVIKKMVEERKSPKQIVKENGLLKISDRNAIEKAVEEAIAENKKAIKDYRKGKTEALNFIVGQVMSKTKGRASPDRVLEMLERKLK